MNDKAGQVMKLMGLKKIQALKMLELTCDIQKICGESEPDMTLINEKLQQRQAVMDAIDSLDDEIAKCTPTDEGMKAAEVLKREIRDIFQRISVADEQNRETLSAKLNGYKADMKNIKDAITRNKAYSGKKVETSGVFIDTRE